MNTLKKDLMEILGLWGLGNKIEIEQCADSIISFFGGYQAVQIEKIEKMKEEWSGSYLKVGSKEVLEILSQVLSILKDKK